MTSPALLHLSLDTDSISEASTATTGAGAVILAALGITSRFNERTGQLCCRLARHFGAGRVYLSEPSAERRSYAEASEVDRAFDPT